MEVAAGPGNKRRAEYGWSIFDGVRQDEKKENQVEALELQVELEEYETTTAMARLRCAQHALKIERATTAQAIGLGLSLEEKVRDMQEAQVDVNESLKKVLGVMMTEIPDIVACPRPYALEKVSGVELGDTIAHMLHKLAPHLAVLSESWVGQSDDGGQRSKRQKVADEWRTL